MIKELEVNSITNVSFADYGYLISNENIEPKMEENTFTFWDDLAEMNIEGKTGFAILEVNKRSKDFTNLERHVKTEEVFFAIDKDVVVLVGKATPNQEVPEIETVKAFKLENGKGVLLYKGTWHWLPYPLAKKARLLVVFQQGTADYDLEIKNLKKLKGITFCIEI
ncbi:MAG: ureidoglycolate lyase [Candidatus Atribacteria bacterium]